MEALICRPLTAAAAGCQHVAQSLSLVGAVDTVRGGGGKEKMELNGLQKKVKSVDSELAGLSGSLMTLPLNSLHAAREYLQTFPKHAFEANWFSESPFCLAFKPQERKKSNPRRRGGWDRGRVSGVGGFPSSPEKGMEVSSCPLTPTPRSTAPGAPPFISSLRKGPEGSGARAESSTLDFARLLHF